MARNVYLLAYDIGSQSRYRQVHKIAKGHGARLQLSVFRCELSPSEAATLWTRLDEVIHHREDRIMIVDLGPAAGLAASRTRWLGAPLEGEEPPGPTIV